MFIVHFMASQNYGPLKINDHIEVKAALSESNKTGYFHNDMGERGSPLI